MAQWKDIDIELTKGTDGDIAHMEDVEAIKNSLINIFSTMQGSRRTLPTFAVSIYQLLFEPIDQYTAQTIGERFVNAIEQWDDRVVIDNLYIEADEDNSMYRILLRFSMKSSDTIETLEYILRVQ